MVPFFVVNVFEVIIKGQFYFFEIFVGVSVFGVGVVHISDVDRMAGALVSTWSSVDCHVGYCIGPKFGPGSLIIVSHPEIMIISAASDTSLDSEDSFLSNIIYVGVIRPVDRVKVQVPV